MGSEDPFDDVPETPDNELPNFDLGLPTTTADFEVHSQKEEDEEKKSDVDGFEPDYSWRDRVIPGTSALTRKAMAQVIRLLDDDMKRMSDGYLMAVNGTHTACHDKMVECRRKINELKKQDPVPEDKVKSLDRKRKYLQVHCDDLLEETRIYNKKMKNMESLKQKLNEEMRYSELKVCPACAKDVFYCSERPLMAPISVPHCRQKEVFHVYHFGCFLARLTLNGTGYKNVLPRELFHFFLAGVSKDMLHAKYNEIHDQFQWAYQFQCCLGDPCDRKFIFFNEIDYQMRNLRQRFHNVFHCLYCDKSSEDNLEDLKEIMTDLDSESEC